MPSGVFYSRTEAAEETQTTSSLRRLASPPVEDPLALSYMLFNSTVSLFTDSDQTGHIFVVIALNFEFEAGSNISNVKYIRRAQTKESHLQPSNKPRRVPGKSS